MPLLHVESRVWTDKNERSRLLQRSKIEPKIFSKNHRRFLAVSISDNQYRFLLNNEKSIGQISEESVRFCCLVDCAKVFCFKP